MCVRALIHACNIFVSVHIHTHTHTCTQLTTACTSIHSTREQLRFLLVPTNVSFPSARTLSTRTLSAFTFLPGTGTRPIRKKSCSNSSEVIAFPFALERLLLALVSEYMCAVLSPSELRSSAMLFPPTPSTSAPAAAPECFDILENPRFATSAPRDTKDPVLPARGSANDNAKQRGGHSTPSSGADTRVGALCCELIPT